MHAYLDCLYSILQHLITQSEIKEAQDSFEDLHVSISADTYEKIDAAVALIELLLTPVSVSSPRLLL